MLEFRKVNPEDVLLCYDWANDPEVRANSYNSKPIELAEHKSWFEKKIRDTNSCYYIAEHNGVPVGQIRFDGGEEKVISFLLAPGSRGKGYGTSMLKEGVAKLLADSPLVKRITGYVKHANVPSNKAFVKAGFTLEEKDNTYPDSYKYVLNIAAL